MGRSWESAGEEGSAEETSDSEEGSNGAETEAEVDGEDDDDEEDDNEEEDYDDEEDDDEESDNAEKTTKEKAPSLRHLPDATPVLCPPTPPMSAVCEEDAATDMEVDDDAFVLPPQSGAPSRCPYSAQEPSVAASVQPLSLHETSAGSGGGSVEVPVSLGCKRARG